MPKYSYVVTEGFVKNHVLIDTVLKEILPSAIESMDIAGVTKVDDLNTPGEAGKIYYNTSDGKYYTYTDNEYTPTNTLPVEDITNFVNKTNPNVIYHYSNTATGTEGYYIYNGSELVNINGNSLPIKDCSSQEPEESDNDLIWEFALAEGKYHLLGEVGDDGTGSVARDNCYVYLSFLPNNNAAVQYVGRFTCISTITLMLPAGINLPDNLSDLEFEAGHTYEFNILYDTCLITDITHTENSGS